MADTLSGPYQVLWNAKSSENSGEKCEGYTPFVGFLTSI